MYHSVMRLSFAAGYGFEEVLKILLDIQGIEVDSRDNDGRTPLSKAKLYGRESIVRLLEEKFGDSRHFKISYLDGLNNDS